jgi:hypothetical protein
MTRLLLCIAGIVMCSGAVACSAHPAPAADAQDAGATVDVQDGGPIDGRDGGPARDFGNPGKEGTIPCTRDCDCPTTVCDTRNHYCNANIFTLPSGVCSANGVDGDCPCNGGRCLDPHTMMPPMDRPAETQGCCFLPDGTIATPSDAACMPMAPP